MQIQINAATRLQAARTNQQAVKDYLASLGIIRYGKISTESNFVEVELMADSWDSYMKSLTKALGKNPKYQGREFQVPKLYYWYPERYTWRVPQKGFVSLCRNKVKAKKNSELKESVKLVIDHQPKLPQGFDEPKL